MKSFIKNISVWLHIHAHKVYLELLNIIDIIVTSKRNLVDPFTKSFPRQSMTLIVGLVALYLQVN